ncbi:MAG: DUF4837 family protein [Flavobacteriales bacterium]|nr:DUF4837 family protein [Flavobacteriales bacterium]
MKKLSRLLLTGLMILSSCKSEKGGKRPADGVKPKSTGRLGELAVVMPESWWQDTAGAAFRHYFGSKYPGLPQVESRFTLVHIPPSAYNRLFKTHRNLVLVEQEDSAGVGFEFNRYATGQLVMALEASSALEFAELLKERGAEAAERFTNAEIDRLYKAHRLIETNEAYNELRAMGLEVTVPNDFRLNLVEDEFIWFFRDKRKVTQGILIYIWETLPDIGMEEAIVAARDSATLRVEGEGADAYMSVEKLYAPVVEATEAQGRFAMETRGLWKMENDFMGGSFINKTIWDEANDRTVSIDGFIYAPGEDKRNYMMELEAIVESLRFVANEE